MLSRKRVIGLVVVVVVMGACIFVVFVKPRNQGEGKTVGVILAGPRSAYGWGDVKGGEYAETTLGKDRVILFDNLNDVDHPELTLHDVVSHMLFSGAKAFFLSSYLPQETPIARKFPNTVFVENVSLEWDVKAMLPKLVIVTFARQGPEPPGTTTHDVSFWAFLIGGLLAMATLVLGIGIFQARRAVPRD